MFTCQGKRVLQVLQVLLKHFSSRHLRKKKIDKTNNRCYYSYNSRYISLNSIGRFCGDQRDDQETDQRCPVLLRALTAILPSGKGLRPTVCQVAPFYRCPQKLIK